MSFTEQASVIDPLVGKFKVTGTSAPKVAQKAKEMRIQVMSDLHQERPYNDYTYSIPKQPGAEYLFLPGDIGSVGMKSHREKFKSWLEKECQKFTKVFWVLGNNECNGSSWDKSVAIGKEWDGSFGGKLVFLERGRFDLNEEGYEVTVLGTTMWSELRDGINITDFQITGNTRNAHNKRFQESFEWLQKEVMKVRAERGDKQRIVVMTHHAPSIFGTHTMAAVPDNRNFSWTRFHNDILGGKGVEGLGTGDCWLFGHTHRSCDFTVDYVRVYSNARGRSRDVTNAQQAVGSAKELWFDETRSIDI